MPLSTEGEKAVDAPMESALQLISVFPNPFRTATNLQFHNPTNGPVELSIYDHAGRLVYEEEKTLEEGVQNWEIHHQQLGQKGFYYYQLLSNNSKVVGKLFYE